MFFSPIKFPHSEYVISKCKIPCGLLQHFFFPTIYISKTTSADSSISTSEAISSKPLKLIHQTNAYNKILLGETEINIHRDYLNTIYIIQYHQLLHFYVIVLIFPYKMTDITDFS